MYERSGGDRGALVQSPIGLHHFTIEIDRRLLAEEKLFWGLLGYSETNALARNRPKCHWLVSRNAKQAVHLHPAESPCVPEYGHHAIVAEAFSDARRQLLAFGFDVQDVSQAWGHSRFYVASPSGHWVEVMSGYPGVIRGMPMEDG
jgi:hypothetical protein